MTDLPVNAVKFSNCIKFSSDENIIKLFSLFDAASRKHILLSYFEKFKVIDQNNTISKAGKDIKIFTRFSKILKAQRAKQNAIKKQKPKLCNISFQLFANIISFCSMKERLICEQVSSQLYDICQMKQSKSHLCINKSFVRNALYHKININKFKHIKYLSIQFVLCNPMKKGNNYPLINDANNFESKYYHIINDIMSNSPHLKTIEYNLTENAFRSFLGDDPKVKNNPWHKQYRGSLFDFAYNLCKISNKNPFTNINKLIWIEKKWRDSNWISGSYGGKSFQYIHQWLVRKENVQKFINIFKNVKSLIIPSDFNLDSYPLVSQIWSNKYYYRYLEHLCINLTDIVDDTGNETDDMVVTEINHPFIIFHKFKKLKSLKICVPIFEGCMNYYNSLLNKNKMNDGIMDIEIHFEIDKYIHEQETLNVIDIIWDYMLEHCRNIVNCKCIVNNKSHFEMNTKHLYINKLNHKTLRSIYYESEPDDIRNNLRPVLRKLNVTNLRELTLCVNKVMDDNIGDYIMNLKLTKFPLLESFKFICKGNGFAQCVSQNIIGFLQFINKQKCLSDTLNYIGILHDICEKNGKQILIGRKTKALMYKIFVNDKTSGQICKLLTSVTTKHKNIKIVELLPVGIKLNELQFLKFWYNGNFGRLNVTQWHKVMRKYFVDMNICTETIKDSKPRKLLTK